MLEGVLNFIKARWPQPDNSRIAKKKDDDYWEDHHKDVLKTLHSYQYFYLLSSDVKQIEYVKISHIILSLFEKSIQLYPETNYFLKELMIFSLKYLSKSMQFLEIFDEEYWKYDLNSKFQNEDELESIDKIRRSIHYSRHNPNEDTDCPDNEDSLRNFTYQYHLSKF